MNGADYQSPFLVPDSQVSSREIPLCLLNGMVSYGTAHACMQQLGWIDGSALLDGCC